MINHDRKMMLVNGEWEIRQGLASAFDHPEKSQAYVAKGCLLTGMHIDGDRYCFMFALPPQGTSE